MRAELSSLRHCRRRKRVSALVGDVRPARRATDPSYRDGGSVARAASGQSADRAPPAVPPGSACRRSAACLGPSIQRARPGPTRFPKSRACSLPRPCNRPPIAPGTHPPGMRPGSTAGSRVGMPASSKRLSYVEKEIEMLQHLRKRRDLRRRWWCRLDRRAHGEGRRVEIVPHIEADRTNRRAVTNAAAHCLRHVVEIAGLRLRQGIEAGTAIGLPELVDAVNQVRWCGPNVAHVVKQYCAEIVSDIRKWQRRSEEHTSELQSHLNLVCRL